MSNEEFIGKMQMGYFGDKNAIEECSQEYLRVKQALNEIDKWVRNYQKEWSKTDEVVKDMNCLLDIINKAKENR